MTQDFEDYDVAQKVNIYPGAQHNMQCLLILILQN